MTTEQQQSTTTVDPDVRCVIAEWLTPGPVSDAHEGLRLRVRREWPALGAALDNLAYR